MNVLQLFRLNIACVKKMFLCLASLNRRHSSKREWQGVIFSAFFLTLEMYKSWRLGRDAQIFLSTVLTACCSLLMSGLVAEPKLLSLVHLVLFLIPTLPPLNIFFLFMFYVLCCSALFWTRPIQRVPFYCACGHVWKDLELFIKIGIRYFSMIRN